MNKYKKITLDGLIFQNPTFMLVLGTCPTLAMIKSATSAVGMGLTVVVILTLSNIIISALRKVIPNSVRIPCYIVVIATLVTFARMFLEKFLPDLHDMLGGFLALIVVNCIILGRAEAFASKHTVPEAAVDGIVRQRLAVRRADYELYDRYAYTACGRVPYIRFKHCGIYLRYRRYRTRAARQGKQACAGKSFEGGGVNYGDFYCNNTFGSAYR